MSSYDLPDVPLEEPLRPPPAPHRRSPVVAPAPRWVAPVYLGLSLLLLPWVAYLGFVLPEHASAEHWDVAWTGFDLMECAALGLTGWFAYRRSTWIEASASAAAALLVADAWFDVTTAAGTTQLLQAAGLAAVVELPLAGLSLWIARHAEQVNESTTRWLVARSSRQARLLREEHAADR